MAINKTKHISVKGKCKWAHVTRLNRYDAWSIELWPLPDDLEVIRDLQAQGLKNVLKKDEEGYNIRFKRDPKREIRLRTGELKTLIFAPPTVTMSDGSPLPSGSSIGNGSDVTVLLEVYTHGTPGGGKAVAARLEGVRVDNLIPFEPARDYETDEERERAAEVAGQPEHRWD